MSWDLGKNGTSQKTDWLSGTHSKVYIKSTKKGECLLFHAAKGKIPDFATTYSHGFSFVLWAVIWLTSKIWPCEISFLLTVLLKAPQGSHGAQHWPWLSMVNGWNRPPVQSYPKKESDEHPLDQSGQSMKGCVSTWFKLNSTYWSDAGFTCPIKATWARRLAVNVLKWSLTHRPVWSQMGGAVYL